MLQDWENFIKFNGITYLNQPWMFHYPEEELEYFGEIGFRLEGNVDDPNYEVKDGDASYLDKGTKIYFIKGYSSDFRLVADTSEKLLLFEADTNPNAAKGSDLLDIGGRVVTIEISSPFDGKNRVASISDPGTVSTLVDIILEAPVDQESPKPGNSRASITFYLYDGVNVRRSFRPDTGELHRGIMLPDDFWETVEPLLPIPSELDGTQWTLIEMDGKGLVEDTHITLYFRDGSVQGFAGCNTYGAEYSTEESGILKIEMPFQTMLGCPFPEGVLEQEREYIEKLANTARYSITGSKLEIYGPGNKKLLVFERIPEYSMEPADLVGTRWKLVSMNGEPVLKDLTITLSFDSDTEASGQAGVFDYSLFYTASGDDIGWGMSEERTGELSKELERQALHYTDSLMWVANYRLTSGTLELYTSKGDTLVYELVEDSDGAN